MRTLHDHQVDVWLLRRSGFQTPLSEALFPELFARYTQTEREVQISRGAFGRPEAPAPFHISLTHSYGVILAGITKHRRIGLDIEKWNGDLRLDAIARECFSPSEWQTFSALTGSQRERCFFFIWTQKEAVAKALGRGLQMSFNEIEVESDANLPPALNRLEGEPTHGWWLLPLQVDGGFSAVVAVDGGPVDMQLLEFEGGTRDQNG